MSRVVVSRRVVEAPPLRPHPFRGVLMCVLEVMGSAEAVLFMFRVGTSGRPQTPSSTTQAKPEARPDGRGAVGRPQNLYTLAPDAPSLGLEPPVFPMLARMLLELAADAGLDDDVVVAAGRDQGRRLAHSAVGSDRSTAPRRPCIDAAVAMLDELGFDPAAVAEDQITIVAFGHCPFADLAESNPELVCALHRGLLTGFVDEAGGAHVEDFHDLSHREPCRATLVAD